MLSSKAKEIIINPQNTLYFSSASIWEIAIKIGLQKLELSFGNLLNEIDMVGFSVLQIENSYLKELTNLPQIHKDPFDRLIIATAQVERMTLITADDNIHKYDVKWVW